MKKSLFCSFLLLFLGFAAVAQTNQDSVSLSLENQIARQHYLSNPDSAIAAANKTLQRATDRKLKFIQAESYFILSKANWVKANYKLSTEYGFKALRIFENTPYVNDWGQTILSIARDFIDLDELHEARSLIHSAQHLAKKNKHEELLADAYREQSLLLSKSGLYDSALLIADEAIKYYEKNHSVSDLGILYSRKAEAYLLKHDYENSLKFNKKSVEYDLLADNKRALSIGYYRLAENYFRLDKLDTAKKLLNASASLAQYIGNLPLRIRCHTMMASIFERERKSQEALVQLKIVAELKDSLQEREKSRVVAETRALFELDNKESAIRFLENENRMERKLIRSQQLVSYFLVAIILLLVLLVIVLWRMRRNQTKAHALLTEKNIAIEKQREEIQKQAENLDQLNQLKTKLFSLISHDLRGPISNIQVLLNMLTQRLMTGEEFLSMSEKLKAELNINQRTLENLLNWSLSQMEGIKTEQNSFDVLHVIDEVAQLMKENAIQKEINIQIVSGCNCAVLADYNHIHLILRNIIHNAIKFSPNQKDIYVITESLSGYCKIIVRDHGVGLTESEIETLLSPHNYYSKAGTHHEKGTGLGLLLCKEFIKRNGGSFHILSTPDKGTEVSFTIPLA